MTGGGAALAALFALAFAWLALLGQSRQEDAAESYCELLTEDLLAETFQLSSPATPNTGLLGAPTVKVLPPNEVNLSTNPEDP